MRRSLILAALFAVLAVPAAASADTATVTTDGDLTLAVAPPERQQLMIGNNAWVGVNIALASQRLDGAVFQGPTSPEASFEAADSTSESFAYQNWGFACDTGACGFTIAEARAAGYLGRYNGKEASPASYPNLKGIDTGKAGYGAAWANKVIAKLGTPVGGTGWEGAFFDDVSVAHPQLPHNGYPDAYASSTAYKDAQKAQLIAARNALWARGFETAGNVGGITEWEARFMPADDLIGVLDYSLIEHCGNWSNGGAQYDVAWDRVIRAGRTAATRGEVLWCHSHANRGSFNDYWTRIVGDPGRYAASVEYAGAYTGPMVWSESYRNDYGTPTTMPQRSGSHAWRSFSGGRTLHVDLTTFAFWTT